MYTSGTSVNVFDTKYGRIGIDICADNHMESIMIGEAMAKMGAKMILAPSSWAVPPERLGEAYGEEWKMPFHHLSSNSGWMYSQLAISVQLLMEHGLVGPASAIRLP